jgi:hypothetical protein
MTTLMPNEMAGRRFRLVAAVAMMLAGMLAAPAIAQKNGNQGNNDTAGVPATSRYYKAEISPSTVLAGSTTSFDIILTNCTASDCDAAHATNGGEAFKSGEIELPAAASLVNPPAPSSNPVWTLTNGGNVYGFVKIGGSQIAPGETFTFNLTATVTSEVPECESIFIEWPAFAYHDTQLPADNPYTLFGDMPLLEVQGVCDTSADMPVNKLVTGISAVCDDANTGAVDESGLGDGSGTFRDETDPDFDAERPCTYSTDPGDVVNTVFLTLADDTDPRFDINVYTTVGTIEDGLPGNTLVGEPPLPFPVSFGIKIPEQFDTEVEWETAFTMCEIQAAPYSLAGVSVMADGVPQVISDIYFLSGTLPGDTEPKMFGCFNTDGPPFDTDVFSVDLNNAPICTFTQGGYGQDRGNNTIGQFLTANFDSIYSNDPNPDGVQIGDRTTLGVLDGATNGYGVLFSTAGAVRDFLPQGGPAGALDVDDTNPTNPDQSSSATAAGVFGGQVLTLQLNVDMGDANAFPYGGGGIGDFLVDFPACYDSSMPTVRQVLADANFLLSDAAGDAPNEADCSINEMNELVDMLNNSFDNCEVNPEAEILRISTALEQ